MNRFHHLTLVALLSVTLSPCLPLSASDAFVYADGEFGQGYFRERDGECMFITAAHVVERAGEITLTTDAMKNIEAELMITFPSDLAVLRARLDDGQRCPKSTWGDGSKLGKLLDMYVKGYIATRLEDGSMLKTEVKVQGYDPFSGIDIISINPKVDISKGFSGSPFFIADTAAGMLLSVENGVGHVIRQDAVNNYLALFFQAGHTYTPNATSRSAPHTPEALANAQVVSAPMREVPTTVSEPVTISGKLAPKAVFEHKFEATANSPLRLSLETSKVRYLVQVIDEDGKEVFRFKKSYASVKNPQAFTPDKSGTHTLRLTGTSFSGEFSLHLEQLSTNTALTGAANVIAPGDTVTGKLAPKAVAEYRFNAQRNSPLTVTVADSRVRYLVQVLDDNDKEIFRFKKNYDGVKEPLAFTPLKSGLHTLRLTGTAFNGEFGFRFDTL